MISFRVPCAYPFAASVLEPVPVLIRVLRPNALQAGAARADGPIAGSEPDRARSDCLRALAFGLPTGNASASASATAASASAATAITTFAAPSRNLRSVV